MKSKPKPLRVRRTFNIIVSKLNPLMAANSFGANNTRHYFSFSKETYKKMNSFQVICNKVKTIRNHTRDRNRFNETRQFVFFPSNYIFPIKCTLADTTRSGSEIFFMDYVDV